MAANSRFAVATHILVSLGLSGERRQNSGEIAQSVNTNPVVIRRILLLLKDAGLVDARTGKSGGVRLAKPVSRISLLDVYRAVEEGGVFAFNPNEANKNCPLSCSMKKVLGPVFQGAEKALEGHLAKLTLSDLIEKI
jgi:Rrf2 family protein